MVPLSLFACVVIRCCFYTVLRALMVIIACPLLREKPRAFEEQEADGLENLRAQPVASPDRAKVKIAGCMDSWVLSNNACLSYLYG